MTDIRSAYLAARVYQHRDAQAFEALFDAYAAKIRAFLGSKLPRPEDAEELTGEAFLRAWEYMVTSEVQHPLALLYRISRNLVADFYRKHQEHQDLSVAEQLPSGQDPRRAAEDKDEAGQLLRKIQDLGGDFTEVLTLHYVMEMKPREIASVMVKTPNAVRILLFKAKRALRDSL